METKKQIIEMRALWNTLALELTVPAKLGADDFAAILLARREPANDMFRARLPMSVAHFKDETHKELEKFAGIAETLSHKELRHAEDKYEQTYMRDIDKINLALFGQNVMAGFWAETRLRTQTEAFVGHIHNDYGKPFAALYLARVLALPILYISGQDQQNASDRIIDLIEKGAYGAGPAYEPFRQELRDMGVLRPFPLGDVGLFLASPQPNDRIGTQHCSSPVPPGEKRFSALFRAFGKMQPS